MRRPLFAACILPLLAGLAHAQINFTPITQLKLVPVMLNRTVARQFAQTIKPLIMQVP